jgi:hypothetical protein
MNPRSKLKKNQRKSRRDLISNRSIKSSAQKKSNQSSNGPIFDQNNKSREVSPLPLKSKFNSNEFQVENENKESQDVFEELI